MAFVPKDRKEGEIKIMGGVHAHESVCCPLLYTKRARGSTRTSTD